MKKTKLYIITIALVSFSCVNEIGQSGSDIDDLEDRVEYLENYIEELETKIEDFEYYFEALETKINNNEWPIETVESRVSDLEWD